MEKMIKVQGMHCTSCNILLTDSIMEITGVKKVSADYKKGSVVVECDTEKTFSEAKKAIEKEGYKVVN